MTTAIATAAPLTLGGSTAAGQVVWVLVTPARFAFEELDESWSETLQIVADSRLVERIYRGLGQVNRGETRSFEDVFGEPL